MHFHLPKPLHGWREFAGEVGIIVIGVLIALASEQLVEHLRWNRELAETRKSLAVELADARFSAAEQVIFGDCVKRQLLALDTLTDAERVPRAMQTKVGIGLRAWGTSSWEAASASGGIAHMSQEERNEYANVYGLLKPLGALQMQEFEVSNDLLTLVPGRRLTQVSRDRLQSDVARLRGLNGMIRLGSQQLVDATTRLRIHLDSDQQAGLEDTRRRARACPLPGARSIAAVSPGKAD